MASRRLALIVLLCTVVAVQCQRQFPSNRFSSRRTSSSVGGQISPQGRSTFSRSSTSSSSAGGRTIISSSSSRGRTSGSRASTGSFSSRRRLGSGATQTTSQLSSRAGGFSSGRPSSSRSSISSTSSSFNSRRQSSRPASTPVSSFGSTRTSSFSSSSSSSSGSRPSSSPFSRQRASSTRLGSRPTSSSSRRKTTTNTRQSSSRSPTLSGSSAFNRGSSSAFSRGSNSAFNRGSSSAVSRGSNSVFTRGSSSSRTRSQTRPQSGGSAFRSGANRNSLLKQASTVNFNCPEPDGFFADQGQCDKYFECKEGVAREHTCPDGLLFHPERSYPCVYPVEADCQGRSALQEPQPTEVCPRQFATFKSAGDQSCGAFTRCINGRAYPSGCPEGLAFDARTLGCEYADLVEDCDAPGYLGFQCPRREFSPDQVGEFTREPHPTNCTKFYVCVNKEDGSVAPRLQGCPEPSVFDPAKGECNDQPQEVPGCEDVIPAAVLAAYQQRSSDEQERREARLAELRAKLTG